MLRTNSRKACENIRAYIMDGFKPDDYTDNPPTKWDDVARFILSVFRAEKYNTGDDRRYYRNCERLAFIDWCAGLCNVLDTCYYYNRSAVDDLAKILDENDREKAKYTEADAEMLLTKLIYRELLKA